MADHQARIGGAVLRRTLAQQGGGAHAEQSRGQAARQAIAYPGAKRIAIGHPRPEIGQQAVVLEQGKDFTRHRRGKAGHLATGHARPLQCVPGWHSKASEASNPPPPRPATASSPRITSPAGSASPGTIAVRPASTQ
jgi:hypothetical protein